MKKLQVFTLAGLLLGLMPPTRAAGAPPPIGRPNIIFILADDLGLGNVGVYGGPFKTPNIDKLAREGLRFTQCYSLPVCGPSRCLLLTDRYPFRTGLLDNSTWNNDLNPGPNSTKDRLTDLTSGSGRASSKNAGAKTKGNDEPE